MVETPFAELATAFPVEHSMTATSTCFESLHVAEVCPIVPQIDPAPPVVAAVTSTNDAELAAVPQAAVGFAASMPDLQQR